MTSELISIRQDMYNKLKQLKDGDHSSFTKVLEKVFEENTNLKKENLKLLKEKAGRV